MSFIKTFDQVTKHTFDQTPVLLETFDQVIRSSEIRSSDPLSEIWLFFIFLKSFYVVIVMSYAFH
jgi:hypothetical protein